MPGIGSARISLKQGPWTGMTLLSRADAGRFILIENGYVNSDGSEIRTMPGYTPVIDPETDQRLTGADTNTGYRCSHIDAHRPVQAAFAPNPYYSVEATPTENMMIWTEPGIMHCFEQVHGRWLIVGESDVRREPILNNARTAGTYVYVTAYEDNAVDIILTLDQQPSTTANLFNAVTVGDRITLDGITGVLATTLNKKSHEVLAFPTATTVRIDTSTGGAIALTPGQTALVSRVPSRARNPFGMSDDAFSDMTMWTSLAKGNEMAAPAELVRVAHVANRMRDFGDATGNLKEGNQNAATINGGTSRRRRMGLPYRIVPHVAGNRLIMAVPGAGCVFQAPVVIPTSFTTLDTFDGLGAVSNDIYDRPRALGIPKAVVWEDPDKSVANSFHVYAPPVPAFGAGDGDRCFGGGAFTARVGRYQFKFAYLDEGTGEVGLCSEPIVVRTDATAGRQGFQFWIYYPGYLLHESLACSINVYRTQKNGDTFFFDRTIRATAARSTFVPNTESGRYGITPESATTQFFHHVHYQAFWISDEQLSLQLNPVPDVLEQMPMGCKAARTIRGYTFFGGGLGDSGSRKEMVKGSITFESDPTGGGLGTIYPEHDEATFMFTNSVTPPIAGSYEGVENFTFLGGKNVPSAYTGQRIVGKTIAPWPRKELDLKLRVNTKVGYDAANPLNFIGRVQDVRFEVRDTPLAKDQIIVDATRRRMDCYLMLPRAKVQISEPDNPNIVPATNTVVIANEIDDDIEGIGDAGGQTIVCTQAKTYLLGWSQSPIGVSPEVGSERFGCIAPNSMVSFEGGCAWISDRGPVAFVGGGVQWIGEAVSPWFIGETARYLRDGDGMMRHSWACHDAERSLIYFGLFSNRNVGTPLEVKIDQGSTGTPLGWEFFRGLSNQDNAWSRFPCDEILVFSYRQNAWSVWRPPQPIQWMTRGVDAHGINRVFMMLQDRRIYVLDDVWAEGDRDTWSESAAATVSGATSYVSAMAHIPSWKGLTIAAVRAVNGVRSLVSKATILTESVVGGITTVTLDGPISYNALDTILIGYRTMRLRTTFVNAKQSDTVESRAAGARFSQDSRATVGGNGPYNSFVQGKLLTGRDINRIPTRRESGLNSDDSSNYKWLGTHASDDPVRDRRLSQGVAVGQNHLVELTFTGDAQVRVQDIYSELA